MLATDLRDAFRGFASNRGVLVAALLSLALGVGANTAIFSVASALLLRPLPYSQADRLVILWNRSPGLGITEDWFSTGQYLDVRNAGSGLEQVAIAYGANENITGDGEPERIATLRVSSNLLPMLGVRAALGRLFTSEEDTRGPANTALLGYRTWVRRYGRDPNVVGRRIELNGRMFQIVGVLPDSFSLPHEVVPTLGNAADADIVLPFPLAPNAAQTRNREDYNIVGRLKPGVTIGQVQMEMDHLTARLRSDFPHFYPPNGGLTFGVVPLQEQVVGSVRPSIALLVGAVACVLLIACANVANLLLSRGVSRQRELAVRAALGASRMRIVRQLLTESVVLGVAGGVLGLVVAFWGLRSMQALGSKSVPRLHEITIDGRVLLFTLALSILSSLIFGLAPAMRAARLDLQSELKDGHGASAGLAPWGRRQRTRQMLVIAELTMAVVLLVGAGLLIRSFARLQRVPPGFNADRVLTLEVTMTGRKYTDIAKVQEAYRELWTRLARVPGALAVGGVSSLPLSQMMAWGPITVEGRTAPAAERFINVDQRVVANEYFRAMEIPLREGRTFTAEDTGTGARVAIVDERMAQQLWPGGDALGKRVRTGGIDASADASWITIVGVVGNIKQDALDADSRMALYLPHTQLTSRGLNLVMRSHGDPAALATAVRKEIHDLDPDLPVYNVRTMTERIDESLARRRFSMLLLSVFAVLASGLAAVGIYGVVAFLVAQGTKEMGIRMALGATPRSIGLLIVRHGLLIAGAGLVLGMAGAVVLTRLMRSLLFGVGPTDGATYLLVGALVTITALAACYLPARKAARLDPMRSLR
ncbi:MAG TPA: ABC transporter permease [Vicinamibacterales bacterium]|nr:ABC transporter permease [Vicinamibacterales bacterium]